jgi:hypothetical protein
VEVESKRFAAFVSQGSKFGVLLWLCQTVIVSFTMMENSFNWMSKKMLTLKVN